jgi:hypothetical protein
MAGKNKNPMLGWHPPAELSAWVKDEAARRGVTVSTILNEAIEEKRVRAAPSTSDVTFPSDDQPNGLDTWDF